MLVPARLLVHHYRFTTNYLKYNSVFMCNYLRTETKSFHLRVWELKGPNSCPALTYRGFLGGQTARAVKTI
jgi:hypothetical protein